MNKIYRIMFKINKKYKKMLIFLLIGFIVYYIFQSQENFETTNKFQLDDKFEMIDVKKFMKIMLEKENRSRDETLDLGKKFVLVKKLFDVYSNDINLLNKDQEAIDKFHELIQSDVIKKI